MNRIIPFILLALTISTGSFAQNCTCETNFLWTKETFEKNDAGFAYIISKKGRAAYDRHTAVYLEKVKHLPNNLDCAIAIDQWVRFFRDGHIGINYLKAQAEAKAIELAKSPYNEQEFRQYLDNKKGTGGMEGIWTFDGYTIGIRKKDSVYTGFVMNVADKNWKNGEIKAVFNERKGLFYNSSKIADTITGIKLVGNTYLQLGGTLMKKTYPEVKEVEAIEKGYRQLTADKPYFEMLNENTAYLRIPSFIIDQKKGIDSVIAKNRAKIFATRNLIIDIRNNRGGNDPAYQAIIPLLYTNPIRIVGALFYSTPLNNQRMLDLSNDPEFDEKSRNTFKQYYAELNAAPGQYIDIFHKDVHIQRADTIHRYPEKIGIIVHHQNISTAEQFIMAAKQSTKVKLFGRTTGGMLDISNVNIVKSPCKDIALHYGLSKSFRIPDFAIDDIGLQPDVFIDHSIEDYQWVEFVNATLSGKY